VMKLVHFLRLFASDMLEVGNLATVTESQTHFGLWCVVSAPLQLSFDMRDNGRLDSVW
jgi:hypothetical protein